MLRFFSSIFLCVLIVVNSQGCQSILAPSRTVIAKSSETLPHWVSDVAASEPKSKVYLVAKKSQVFRLELGIKQLQAWAIQNKNQLLYERVLLGLKGKLAQVKSSDGITDETLIQTVAPTLQKQVKVSRDPVMENVYWEQIRAETPDGPKTFYEIYALGILPRSEYDVSLSLAGPILQKIGNPKATALATALIQTPETEPESASEVESVRTPEKTEEPIEGAK